MNAPSVSVVIPFFNSAATLHRALTSVASQSWPVLEVLVIDDASQPGELAQARSIAAAFDYVVIHSLERNGGPANARNVGWDKAAGDWVAFLDSDDAWHPKKLEVQFRAAQSISPPPVLIGSHNIVVDEPSELANAEVREPAEVGWVTKHGLLQRNCLATASVVVKRDLPQRFPLGRRFSEDYELWLVIVGAGNSVIRVDEPLVALFKPPYGASGLSSQTWRMIAGEYRAYFGARSAGSLTMLDVAGGILSSSARAVVRVGRIYWRKARGR